MNNTLEVDLFLAHLGDELLSVYGDFPTGQVKGINISPKKALTVVQTRLSATDHDWKLNNQLSSCYRRHMKPVFERRCTLPWTDHFTNISDLGNCTNEDILDLLISSRRMSAWLIYNSTGEHKHIRTRIRTGAYQVG